MHSTTIYKLIFSSSLDTLRGRLEIPNTGLGLYLVVLHRYRNVTHSIYLSSVIFELIRLFVRTRICMYHSMQTKNESSASNETDHHTVVRGVVLL